VGQENESATHVFISYGHVDSVAVDRLQHCLESAGLRVWRDTADLWPGQDRRARIRQAISSNALVFIACFSTSSLARVSSSQNEEFTLAIEEIRRRLVAVPWIIPVRFDSCEIPDLELGGGRSLRSIQRADLFGPDISNNLERLVTTIRELAGEHPAAAVTAWPLPPGNSATSGIVSQADRGRSADLAPGSAGRELDVLGTRSSQSLRLPVVDLMDRQAGVFLTVRVSQAEAVSIAYAKEGISARSDQEHSASYVLPHDLLVGALDAIGVPMLSGEICGAPNRKLTARLMLAGERMVTCTPADAIALALRARTPLIAPAGLLDQASTGIPGQHDDQTWLGGAARFDQAAVRAPAALISPAPGTVAVSVTGIGAGPEADEPAVLLKAAPDGWIVPVCISPIEAEAVDAARRGELSRCPSAHLLFHDLLRKTGAALVAALITGQSDAAAVAELTFSSGQRMPARVGDALTLALLTGANIFASVDLPDAVPLLD
jgi:bifunctional DNase/RNase